MINYSVQQQIIAHADRLAPKECCGFILEGDLVFPCENIHPEPENHFRIGINDRAAAETIAPIKALYHSHVAGFRDFSPDDIIVSRRERLPFVLYYQPKPEFFYFDPAEIPAYTGREFHFAYRNCYELVRDWYKCELEVDLKECYPVRPDIWDEPDFDPIALINPLEQGFVPFAKEAELQNHDIVQMRIGKQVQGCHLGVIVNVNRNHMLHHLSDRLSEITVYGGDWWKSTVRVWRHKSLC